MGKKVIPFQKPGNPVNTTGGVTHEQFRLEASGESIRAQLAEQLKEEAERARTVALLLKVAETICREGDGSRQGKDRPQTT